MILKAWNKGREYVPFYKARIIKAWFSVKANKESSRAEKVV